MEKNLQDFRGWCGNINKYQGYANSLGNWADKKSNPYGCLVECLPDIYTTYPEKAKKIFDILMSEALREKYQLQNTEKKSYGSKKRKNIASKKRNTADNIIAHLNKYWFWIKKVHGNSMQTGFIMQNNGQIDKIISDFDNKTIKEQKKLIGKLKGSLETQNRVYKGMPNNGDLFIFPIGLIEKILGGRKGLGDWLNDIINKINVYVNRKTIGVDQIKSIQIIPYKKVVVKTNDGKEYILYGRKDADSPFKPMKPSKIDDISIGHMPPISEVIEGLLKNDPDALPALQELTKKIKDWFENKRLDLNQDSLKKNTAKIYDDIKHSLDDDFSERLKADLNEIEGKSSYELQDRSENISMGGINRKK
ncbi:MAG: hypothetical protein II708_02280 [Paludibacteraceae bacterium]|nr:hypothetical protein [Paludibacteraceae bacterium]